MITLIPAAFFIDFIPVHNPLAKSESNAIILDAMNNLFTKVLSAISKTLVRYEYVWGQPL